MADEETWSSLEWELDPVEIADYAMYRNMSLMVFAVGLSNWGASLDGNLVVDNIHPTADAAKDALREYIQSLGILCP